LKPLLDLQELPPLLPDEIIARARIGYRRRLAKSKELRLIPLLASEVPLLGFELLAGLHGSILQPSASIYFPDTVAPLNIQRRNMLNTTGAITSRLTSCADFLMIFPGRK